MDGISVGTLIALAVTSYGEVEEDRPTWAQRELHVYTNLVRVDPMAWSADYGCSTSAFSSTERQARPPLLYHDGLTEIAQLHSEDMAAHGFLDHDSWDGTSFSERVWPYYPGTTIGENVAYGYSDNAAAIWQGWMCSSGHRANIMAAQFTDLGCGVQGTYYTQDLGGGSGQEHRPVAMGVHVPERPQGQVRFLATFDGSAPAWFGVETDTACLDLERIVGDDSTGGWSVTASAQSDCVRYRFVWETTEGATRAMPSSGSYQYGQGCEPWVEDVPDGCSNDSGTVDTGWEDTAAHCEPTPQDRNGDCRPDKTLETPLAEGCGCGDAGAAGATWGLLLAVLGVKRRRRMQA